MIQKAWRVQTAVVPFRQPVDVDLEAISDLEDRIFTGIHARDWGTSTEGHQEGWDPVSEFEAGMLDVVEGSTVSNVQTVDQKVGNLSVASAVLT